MTNGRWDHSHLGLAEESSPPGAQLVAHFSPELDASGVDESWNKLAHGLAGTMCGSLNFFDTRQSTYASGVVANPVLSFLRHGSNSTAQNDPRLVRVGHLPKEVVCTENLVPFIRLLPSRGRSGLSSMLNSVRLFSSYHSMAIRYWKSNALTDHAHLSMSISAVVPNPKPGNGWRLSELLERDPFRLSPLASETHIFVSLPGATVPRFGPQVRPLDCSATEPIDWPSELQVHVSQGAHTPTVCKGADSLPVLSYSLTRESVCDNAVELSVKQPSSISIRNAIVSPLQATRYQTKRTQLGGSILTLFYNPTDEPLSFAYFDAIAPQLQIWTHSLSVELNASQMHHSQALREFRLEPSSLGHGPTQIEFRATLAPRTSLSFSLDFSKKYLPMEAHSPDAARGFDLSPASITVDHPSGTWTVHTESMIVTPPTPDFSMPYNVITLSTTVIALFFGAVFNSLTRRQRQLEIASRTREEKPKTD